MDDDERNAYWGGYDDGQRDAVYVYDDNERNATEGAEGAMELRNKRRKRRPPGPMVPWQSAPPQVVVQAPPPPKPEPKKGVFDSVPRGAMVGAAAQVLSALMPLPPAPSATGDTKTDLDNVLRYQANLADHSKRDQQIRALGAAVGLLV